jgi:hypothetical protein
MGLTYVVHFLTYLHGVSQKKVYEHPYVVPGRRTVMWLWLQIGLLSITIVLAILSAVLFVFGLLAVERAATSLPSRRGDDDPRHLLRARPRGCSCFSGNADL